MKATIQWTKNESRDEKLLEADAFEYDNSPKLKLEHLFSNNLAHPYSLTVFNKMLKCYKCNVISNSV